MTQLHYLLEVLKYIKSIYPEEWLEYGKAFQREKYDEYGEIGLKIKHPKNPNYELDILILEERVGIVKLKNIEKDILIDLSGFDYSFEKAEENALKKMLWKYYKFAEI